MPAPCHLPEWTARPPIVLSAEGAHLGLGVPLPGCMKGFILMRGPAVLPSVDSGPQEAACGLGHLRLAATRLHFHQLRLLRF